MDIEQIARKSGGVAYRNRHVEGTAFAFGPEALKKFVAAVAEECKPREITPTVALELYGKGDWAYVANRLNRYVRGEDA